MSERVSQQTFFGVLALLFIASVVLTIMSCVSMSRMSSMPMPGGWTMSMIWMPMPGQTLAGSAASFLGMWVAMMVAMMLPSLTPMLWRYRQVAGDIGVALVATGYFFVWMLSGAVAYALGIALSAVLMQQRALARAVPVASGVVVLFASALQFTAWKVRQLACCRATPGCCLGLRADLATAWRHGLRMGVNCCHCCSGLTVVLLVVGMMDLRVMGAVTAAITAERLAPAGRRVAGVIGVISIVVGLWLTARAVQGV
jgi:predicted metal-binding membrane protein